MPRKVKVEDEKILQKITQSKDPVSTAPELASQLPLKRDGVRNRLKQMEKDGKVVSKEVGARSVVWWVQ